MAIYWRILMEITKIHHGPWALVKLWYRIKLLGMIPNQYYIYINYHLHPFTSWRRAEVVTTHRILDQPSIGSRKTLSMVDFGWSECFNKTMITSNPIQICRNPADVSRGIRKKKQRLCSSEGPQRCRLPIRNGGFDQIWVCLKIV